MPPVGVYSPREEGRRFKETASPFRRDGIAVPAQRHHRSGATASPFRHNGIAVPARRHRRFKAFEHPFRACPAGEKGAVDRDIPGF